MQKRSAKTQTSYERGVWAEGMAALFLMGKGYKILRRRYKTRYGEIDLIVRKGGILCFVEVKARSSEEAALSVIDARGRRRIENAALHFISENQEFSESVMRFDVVAVIPPLRVVHLDNAWEACS